MADFKNAFEKIIINEGGYVNDPADPGGETYKGVARKIWNSWLGWHIVDLLKTKEGFPDNLEENQELQQEVENFYEVNFWNQIKGSLISDQGTANSIMDFAVNAGVGTSVSLAQKVVKTEADGKIGNNTLTTINSFNPEHFQTAFTVEKIKNYVSICKKRPESKKFFFGWIDRAVNH